jgi:hypothetical protein
MSMHKRLLAGGLIVAAISVGLALRNSAIGDTKPQPEPRKPTDDHEPFTPYGLGPHPIAIEDLAPDEQEAVARIGDKLEASQPVGSSDAYSDAVSTTVERMQLELAERQVGLVGTGEDGVVP